MANERIYLDTCVLVAVGLAESGRYENSLDALRAAEAGQIEAVISGLVRAEASGFGCVKAPQGQSARVGKEQLAAVDALFDSQFFKYVELTETVGRRAASLASSLDLKGPDACHIVMAQIAQCDKLYTYDGKLIAKNGRVGTLTICEPEERTTPLTFDGLTGQDGKPMRFS